VKNDKDWVIVGRMGRPHGLKGGISIYSLTEPKDNLLAYSDWHVCIKGCWTALNRLREEEHNRCIVAFFENYGDRDKAAQLTNLEIAVSRSQLPELTAGEYYWHQLIGLNVVNTKGLVLGTVKELIATGSNDVLVVTGDARYLIPYRYGSVVLDISEEKRQITVDWDDEYI
jgi:16S rRNA processing protein RimM